MINNSWLFLKTSKWAAYECLSLVTTFWSYFTTYIMGLHRRLKPSVVWNIEFKTPEVSGIQQFWALWWTSQRVTVSYNVFEMSNAWLTISGTEITRVNCYHKSWNAAKQRCKGLVFRSSWDCTKDVPSITGRLDMAAGSPCLSWWYFDPISECPSKYLKTPDGKLCVTLTPQRGLYLPGWHRQRSQLVTLDGRPARCTSGYLLRVASSCSVVWRDYTAGNPVPKRAVVGGTWTDGTPLYIVADYIKLRWIVGYYHPSIQRSFFMRTGQIYNPEDMKILLFN